MKPRIAHQNSANTYGSYVYQGAYIYGVSIADGFTLKGRITQYADDEVKEKSGYYWTGDKDISRIIYIGDYFYTISGTEVLANTIADLAEIRKSYFERCEKCVR